MSDGEQSFEGILDTDGDARDRNSSDDVRIPEAPASASDPAAWDYYPDGIADWHSYCTVDYAISASNSDDLLDAFRYIAAGYGPILDGRPRAIRYLDDLLSECVYRVREWVATLQVRSHSWVATMARHRRNPRG